MPSQHLYAGRKYYRWRAKHIFIELAQGGAPNYIDMWGESPLYGKMGPDGTLALPQEKFMNYSLGANRLGALPWVYEGITDFQSYLNRGIYHGRTALNELFGSFGVAQGYKSPYLEYMQYALTILTGFNKRLGARTKKIVFNFADYVKEFTAHLALGNVPFTFASYYASPRASAFSTGLVVSFADMNANNDFYKGEYFENPEFGKYVQSAANFGFRVDLNAPWRLVADLKSAPMAKYMLRHNVPDLNASFQRFYSLAINYEISATTALLVTAYEAYQETRQYGVTQDYCIKPNPYFKSASDIEVVKSISQQVFIEEYSTHQFLEDYDLPQTLILLESLKHAERKKLHLPTYKAFKRQFMRHIKRRNFQSAAISLTRFYNGIPPKKKK